MFIDGPVAEAFSAQVSSHGLIDIEHRLRMARSDFKLAVPNEIEIASAVQDAAAVRADRRRTRNIDPGKHLAAARGDRSDKDGSAKGRRVGKECVGTGRLRGSTYQ